jgi:hypothetical protein
MSFTAAEIAQHLQGEVLGDSGVVLNNFAQADHAQPGDLTFAENADYLARAEQSAATAVIVGAALTSKIKVLIRVANARVAFAKALALFFPEPTFPPGVHPSAVVASDATVDPSAHIGPHCVVGSRSKIGPLGALFGVGILDQLFAQLRFELVDVVLSHRRAGLSSAPGPASSADGPIAGRGRVPHYELIWIILRQLFEMR